MHFTDVRAGKHIKIFFLILSLSLPPLSLLHPLSIFLPCHSSFLYLPLTTTTLSLSLSLCLTFCLSLIPLSNPHLPIYLPPSLLPSLLLPSLIFGKINVHPAFQILDHAVASHFHIEFPVSHTAWSTCVKSRQWWFGIWSWFYILCLQPQPTELL